MIIKNAFRWAKLRFSKLKIFQKIIVIAVIAAVGWWGYSRTFGSSAGKIAYQTDVAQVGTLVVSISSSGQVSSANNTSITTQASGVVKKVFVTNDQQVSAGDRIAELELDLDGQLRASQAWASYQSAQNNLESARATLNSLNSQMWVANQKLINDAVARSLEEDNPAYIEQHSDWLAAEARYKIQQQAILQAQTSLNSAWLSYRQSSPVIYAPISGTITGLSLQTGTVLLAQSNSSGTASSQKIASIKTSAPPQISVSLAQTDVTRVKIGDKATVTLDAITDRTFSGKVISIDTIGSISSGVSTYPAIISLDQASPDILPNMSATASIIIKVVDSVVLVPSSAVQTVGGQSSVRLMVGGQVQSVSVEVGDTDSAQTVILSGIKEGDTVVTSVGTGSSSAARSTGTTSVFSTFGRTGAGAAGGAVRVIGR